MYPQHNHYAILKLKGENKTMMSYDMMQGVNGGGMMFFAWLIYLLVAIALALSIAALWKYINKK